MDNQLHKDLVNMRKLLAQPHSWAQGAPAYTGAGDKVAPWDDAARCWCLTGAAHCVLYDAANGGVRGMAISAALCAAITHELKPNEAFLGISGWNDNTTRTHADVLALLDRAIATVAP